MNRLARLLLLVLAALAAAPALAQLPPGGRAMDVSLVPGERHGDRVAIAFVMRPKPGWHGYWQNPGDAGQPATVEWQLPPGASAGPLRYPVPQRLIVAGMMNYVFAKDHALLSELRVPAGAGPLPVTATIRYLVCTEQVCVPESATVSADAAKGGSLDAWTQALPRPLGGEARYEIEDGTLRLGIPMPAAVGLDDPYFYPLTEGALRYAAAQRVSRRGDWLIVETQAGDAKPAALEGVLAIGGGQGLSLAARPGPVPAAGVPVAAPAEAAKPAIAAAVSGALLGGLLLNVMPCVFPILSLKALSLAKAGGDEGAARREALAYSAGVVLVCVALGALLLAVRAGGAAVGWAFQLQDPRVTLFLLMLVAAIALNLAGLFELPSIGVGGGLAARSGPAGAFWTGALAAFVATPCTGPFMGAALGAALVLPAAAALAVFAGLGLGLALPFLLVGFVPALRRRLPRPGPWMGTLRRILAVPMALTALWLGWLLERQAGGAAMLVALAGTAAVGALLWWARRRHGWLALAPATAAAAAAVLIVPTAVMPTAAVARGLAGAEPFSEARLAALRAAGRPVFVYFTADWCLTCKVNEKAVLEREAVAAAFRRGNVAVLVGDWTRGNAEIGRFLEKQGRSGVPLYLWYAPGKPAEILPQILTLAEVTRLR
ncbi:MAG: thioredoxin family protein [Alphaproteobacteria bacterium]|nr:thioredoxin family protein [Alphaproteobacteria bacterium]MBV9370416.1 thioredoxin family protein [Alphaproteobacteria bacterium]MBV9900844.1 thioredoxin family protein [Alphaproteobacteria bacterium]